MATPASRGYVVPLSPEPTAKPYTLHNYLAEEADMARMVEASVMPTVHRGNINAPTIAIAERTADLIRHDAAAVAAQGAVA